MPSVKKAKKAAEMARASDSDGISQTVGSGSDSDASSDSGSDSGSDSDALDSSEPRKRRRTSPGAHGAATFKPTFNAPSRFNRKQEPQEPAAPVEARPPGILAPIDYNTTFESLGVSPWLVQSLASMAIKRPTGIQKGCIPEILKGKDCIGGSRTGSGKTVAFAAPILQQWAKDPQAIYALILTPTR